MLFRSGVAVPEDDNVRIEREAREAGDCRGSDRSRVIKPGESWDDPEYFDTIKSGTYDFIVEEKVFSPDRKSYVTVKSNTFRILVPPFGERTPAQN